MAYYGNLMGKAAAGYLGRYATQTGLRYISKMYRPKASINRSRTVYSYGNTSRRNFSSTPAYGPVKLDDTALALQQTSDDGYFYHVGGADKGTTNYNRIGSKMKIFGMTLKGRIKAGTTQTAPIMFKVCVIQDKLPGGAAPVASDVWDTDANPVALSNRANQSRFRQLWSRTYEITGEADTLSGVFPMKTIDTYIKFRSPIITEYDKDSTSGIVDGQIRNALYVVVSSDASTTGDNVPTFFGKCRCYFRDV